MKRIVSLAMVAILPVFAFAASTSMNLSDALKKEVVKMEAVNTKGNYTGKSVKLTITNNSNASLEIKVNLGIILKPSNPAFQPLVLSGEESLALKAHEKGEVEVETFCGNAPKACPIPDLSYSFLRVGSDTLVKILRFIKDNSLFDHLGQAAVWVVTNEHDLSNVYDNTRDLLSIKLIGIISLATGQEKPDFYAVSATNETPAQPAYTAKTEKIYIPFDISLSTSKVLSIGIFSPKGQWIKSIFERKLFEPGKHNLMAELDPSGFEAGKYFVRLMDPEKTLQQKEIKVE